jgi:hypothetical protein
MLSTKVENSSLNGAPICVLRGTAYTRASDVIRVADNCAMNVLIACSVTHITLELHMRTQRICKQSSNTERNDCAITCSTIYDSTHTPEATLLAQASSTPVSSKQCAGPPAVASKAYVYFGTSKPTVSIAYIVHISGKYSNYRISQYSCCM